MKIKRFLNRLVSALLVGCMLVTMLPSLGALAAETETEVYKQDFEGEVTFQGTPSGAEVAELEEGQNHVLKITDEDSAATSKANLSFAAQSGKITITFRVNILDDSSTLYMTCGSHEQTNTWATSGNGQVLRLTFGNANKRLQFRGGHQSSNSGTTNNSYAIGDWTQVKVILDTNAGKFSVYSGETLLGETELGYPAAAGVTDLGKIDNIAFSTNGANFAHAYVDDIAVSVTTVTEEPPVETPDPGEDAAFCQDFEEEVTYADKVCATDDSDVQVVPNGDNGNKVLEVKDTDTGSGASRVMFQFAPLSGEIVISYKMQVLSDVEGTKGITFVCGSKENTGNLATATARQILRIKATNGKQFQHKGGGDSSTTNNGTYSFDQWFSMKLVLNTDKGTYAFYVDDAEEPAGSGNLSYSAAGTALDKIDNIGFMSDTSGVAHVYLDDITVTAKSAGEDPDDPPKEEPADTWTAAEMPDSFTTEADQTLVTLKSGVTMQVGSGAWVSASRNVNGVSTKYINCNGDGDSVSLSAKRGPYFKFAIPAQIEAGQLTVSLRVNAEKQLNVLDDGEFMSGYPAEAKSEAEDREIKIDVEGGHVYTVYILATRPYFYGFSFQKVDRDTQVAQLQKEVDALTDAFILGENASAGAVDKDLNLVNYWTSPTFGACDVVWSSNSPAVATDGTVDRLATATQVKVTGHFSVQQSSYLAADRVFTVTVTAFEDDALAVAETKEALSLGDTSAVKKNLTLPATGLHGTTVTWKSDDPAVVSIEGNVGVIHPNDTANQTATLTATITRGGQTATKTFTVTVARAYIVALNARAYATADGEPRFAPVDGGKLHTLNLTAAQELDDTYKLKVEILNSDGSSKSPAVVSGEVGAGTFFAEHGVGVSMPLTVDLPMDSSDLFRFTVSDATNTYATITSSPADNEMKAGAKVYVVGDSTAAAYNETAYPQTGWAQVLERYFDGVEVVDLGIGGRSSLDYKQQAQYKSLQTSLAAGDYLLIQFGHNDSKSEDPTLYTDPALDRFEDGASPSYKKSMAEFVTMAWEKGANPVILTSISRRRSPDSTGKLYADAARALAAELSVPCVDLFSDTSAWIAAQGSLDNATDMFNVVKAQDSRFYYDPEYTEASKAWAGNDGSPDYTHVNINGAKLIAMYAADELKTLGVSLGDRRNGFAVPETLASYAEAGSGPKTPAEIGRINFSDNGWKLQLPVEDPNKPGSVLEKSPTDLANGYHDDDFYADVDDGGDYAVVFHTPVDGFKTANTTYSRSELREMLDPSDKTVNWTWEGTHTLKAEQRVTHVPASGKVITSQIHGIEQNGDNANPLVKVSYAYNAAAQTGKVLVEIKETTASNSGDAKYEFANVPLGQRYKTVIQVVDGVASVTVSTVENGTERSQTFTKDFVAADANWKNTLYYFKLGSYIQDNTDTSAGAYADVWAYRAAITHVEPGVATLPSSLTVTAGTSSVSNKYPVDGAGNQTLTFTVTPSATAGLGGGIKAFADVEGQKVEVLRLKLDGGTFKLAEVLNGSATYTSLGTYTAGAAYTLKVVIVPKTGTQAAFVKVYQVSGQTQTQLGETYAMSAADLGQITQLDFFADSNGAGSFAYTGIDFQANATLTDEESAPPSGGGGEEPPAEPDDPSKDWTAVYKQDFEGDVTFQGTPSGMEVTALEGGNHILKVTDEDSTTSKGNLSFEPQSGEIAIAFRVNILDDDTMLYMTCGSQAQTGTWATSNNGQLLRLTFGNANKRLQFRGGHQSSNSGNTSDNNNTYKVGDWTQVTVVLNTKAGKFSVYSGGKLLGETELGYPAAVGVTDLGKIDNIAFSTNSAGTAYAYVDDIVVRVKDAGTGPDDPDPGPGGTEYWVPAQSDGETFTTTTDQVIATLPSSGVTMAVGEASWTVTANKNTALNGVTYTKHIAADKGNSPNLITGKGEYFKFAIPESISAGELVVALRVNAGKTLFVLEDDHAMAGYEDPQPAEAATETALKLSVVGGKTYSVYVQSSMPYFYGFSFRPVDKEADLAAFQAEIDKLDFNWIRGENTDANAVDKDLYLTTFYTSPTFGGCDVNWTSNSVAVASDGKVNQLAQDALVTLTAHISAQQISYLNLDKEFKVTVTALADDAQAVARAKEALDLGAISAVKKDLVLPAEGMHGTAITWVSSDPAVLSVDAANGLGVIHPNDTNVQTVTLTATITRGGVTETKEFVVTVAAVKILDVNSWAYATASGDAHFVPVDGGKLHSINVTNNDQHLDTNDYRFKVEVLGPDGSVKSSSREMTASAFFAHGPGVSEYVELDLAMDSGDTFRVTAYDDAKTYVTFTHGAADDVPAPGAKIYVIGDSTAAAYDNKKYPQTGWAQVLEGFFDGVEVVDLAVPGRSSLDFKTRPQFETLKTEIRPGDYLIIQFGHNDSHNADASIYTDPTLDRFADGAAPSYKKHMAEYVTLAWDAGAYPIIATSISRRKLNDTDGVRYGNAAKALAAELSIPCVDVFAATNGWVNHVGLDESIDMFNIIKPEDSRFYNDPQYAQSEIREAGNDGVVTSWDNTHVNINGAELIAMFAADGMKALGIPVGTKRNSAVVSSTLPHYADAISGAPVELPETLIVTAQEAGADTREFPVSGAGRHTLTFTVTPSAGQGLSGGVKFLTGVGYNKTEALRLVMDNGTFKLFAASNASPAVSTASPAECVELGSYAPGVSYTLKVVIVPRTGGEQPAYVEVYRVEDGGAETQLGETCVMETADVREITRLDFYADAGGQGSFTYRGIDFQTEIIPELEYAPPAGGGDEPTPPDPSGELPDSLSVTAGESSVTYKYPVTTGTGNVALTFTVTPTATAGLHGGVKFYCDATELVRFKLDGGVFKLSEIVNGAASYTSFGAYEAGKAYTVKLVFVPAGENGETRVYVCLDGEQIGSIPLAQTDPKTIDGLRFFADSGGAGSLEYRNMSYASNVDFKPEANPSTTQYLLKNPGAWTLGETASIENEKLTVQAGTASSNNRVDVSGEGVKSLSFTVAVDVDNIKDLKGGVNFRDANGNTVLRFKLQGGRFRLSDLQTDENGKTLYQQTGGYFAKRDSFQIKLVLYPATATREAYVKVYKDGQVICDAYTLKGAAASTLESVTRLYFFTDANSAGMYTYSDMIYKTGPMTPAQTGCIDFIEDGWKLQLPVESAQGGSVMEISPAELAEGYFDEYFYADMDDNGDYAVVFHSPVDGFKTTNAQYTRSELREMPDPSDKTVNWTWQGTHTLVAEQRVTHVPANGQVITAQIHGIEKNGDNANPLVKVRYVYDRTAGTGKIVVELKETTAANSGDAKYTFPNVALGQKYKTVIRVVDGVASVTVSTVENGVERAETYRYNFVAGDAGWKNTLYYFKLGCYIQDNADTGADAYADVWVYGASVSHQERHVAMPSGDRHSSSKTQYSDGGNTVVETWLDGTVITTHTAANGDTMWIRQNPDNTVRITVTAQNGNADVAVDADGRARAKVEISEPAASRARQNGEALTLPVPQLTPGRDLDSAPVVEIAKRAGSELLVKLPGKQLSAGTVPVAVHPDGTREIVKMSVPTQDGVIFKISGNVTLKLVDNARQFDDVGSGHWAAEAVDFASGRELLVGTAENLFSPDGTTTRAMVVTILARLDGVDTAGGETWYSKGMDWAVSQDISDGANPEALISREQFVTMLYRYGGQPAVTGNALGGFADGAAVSSWATRAMQWAVANGILRGRSDGALDPAGATTRAEAATLLMRYCRWALGVPLEASVPGAEIVETVAFENDFNAEKLGRSWAVGAKVVELDGERVVEITDSDTAKSTALNYAFPAQSGKVTISFKLYIDPADANSVIALTAGSKAQTGKYSSNSAGEYLRLKTVPSSKRFQFRGGDSAKSSSANGGSYRCGEWIDVRVVVDTDAKTFSVYAGGELLGESQPMSNKNNADMNSIDNITFMTEKEGLGRVYIDDVKVTSRSREFSVWDEAVEDYMTVPGGGTGLLKDKTQWQLKQGEIKGGALIVTAGEDSAANKIAVSGTGNKELIFTVVSGSEAGAKGGVRFVSEGKEILRFKLDGGKFKITDMRADESGKVLYATLGAYSENTAYEVRILCLEKTATQAACVKVYVNGQQVGGAYTLTDEAAAAMASVTELNFFTDKACTGTLTYRDMAYGTGVDAGEDTPAQGGNGVDLSQTPAGTGAIDFLKDGWKIQIPVENPAKAGSVMERTPQELADGYTDEFIYAAKDEDGTPAVVFHSPVEGFKTGNTSYARSELRELLDPSDSKVNWTWQGTHTLVAEERVTHVPASGQVITSQIHGIEQNGDNANPLVKVRYVYDWAAGMGKVVVELKNTTSPTSYDFKYSFPNVALGQKYKTEIQVVDGSVCVTIATTDPNGGERSETYRHDFVAADPYWKETWYYFKLGNYIQDNTDTGENAYADVWVYSSGITHSDSVEKVPVDRITMDQPSVSIRSGERTGLTVSAAPIKAYDKSVTWAVTAGSDVAVVDKDGFVTGIKEGVATVTATSVSNPAATASCTVTVKDVAIVEVKPVFAQDFGTDSGKTDPEGYGGAGCEIVKNAPAGTDVTVVNEGGNNLVTLRDDTNAAPAKLSFAFAPQTDTTTIAFKVRIDALGERKAGGTDFGRMYMVAAGSDGWYSDSTELFRIRNNAKGTLGNFSGLSYVLTNHYDEIAMNADKVTGGYGDWVDVVYIVTPNNGTAKANTTDVYMNGYPVAMAVANRNTVDYVNRLDIQTGTDDKLTFSVDDVRVYTGIVLPENTALVKPTALALVRVPSVMAVADSARAAVEVVPAEGHEEVRYSVISGDAVCVSEDGYVTAARAGVAEVRAESVLDSTVFAQQTITVQPTVTRPEALVVPAAVHVAPGEKQQMQVTVLPANATEKGLKYEIASGSDVAGVDSRGVVTGKTVGTAYVRVTSLSDPSVYETVPVSVTQTLAPGALIFADNFNAGELDSASWSVSLAKDNTFVEMKDGAMTFIDANTAANPKVALDFTPASGKVSIQFKIKVEGEVTMQGGSVKPTGYRNLRIAFGSGNITATANESFCIRSNGTYFTYNTSGTTYVEMPGDYNISEWNEVTLVTTIHTAGADTTDVYINGVKVLAGAPNKVDYPAIDKLCFSADTANVAAFTIDDLGIWAGDYADKPADMNAKRFLDVPAGHWAQEAVSFVSDRGLLTGVGNGAFAPDATTTRATVVTILARLDGVDTSGGETWYSKGTNWAVSQGISDGANPNAPISREQFVTMLYRYAGQPTAAGQSLSGFADGAAVSAWAVPAMEWAVATGLTQGRPDGTLDPTGTTTRAEAAVLLMRYCRWSEAGR